MSVAETSGGAFGQAPHLLPLPAIALTTVKTSLKYHRLHPEYIYTRIRNLQGKYNLRILLVLVDIPNHEDALRELSKTSMVNNVTIMLCWSAAEAARYIELYKSYETANFNAIRGQQSSTYADKLVDFVTVPRSLNKSDAVALVANFGSLKNAVNADPEHLSMISGWGGVKVKRWSAAMDEPFRAPKAAKKSLKKKPVATADEATGSQESARIFHLEQALPLSRVSRREVSSQVSSSRRSPAESASNTAGLGTSSAPQLHSLDQDDDLVDEQKALLAAAIKESQETSQPMYTTGTRSEAARDQEELLSGGVAAALAKLREGS